MDQTQEKNITHSNNIVKINTLSTIEEAILTLKQGKGVLVVDDESRENEVDFIFSAEHLTTAQMALMIREGSGIVCLCLETSRCETLDIPQMVTDNNSQNNTAYTVSIEAHEGVTTGVSALDRVTTIKAAINPKATPQSLSRPGHVFPLQAVEGGVLKRRGHTEASIDLMKLAQLNPAGVICELTNPDGTMVRLTQALRYAAENDFPVISIEDLVIHLKKNQ
ncbi:3,4 dihydroxy-2-butanone-4-phosphate synthase [Psychromonas sp. CNPT3]|uniref:3,4-dihydroxy-2-butanone-4-phosphate synthase n=1 Tax=Psychromonas sp. CNPT3 TaxID=314282 RepID=UPI00006E9CC9|nr:3,4-dihydroxy-2-butanone-4-phosphate synthase [Psychromonas sp. CNPT3]AGH81923.1 3,4 dihydroxy-2-butanone-4-phosphate synthase [Psychromonas sp. CNPT3]